MRVIERTFSSLRDNLDFDDSLLDDADRGGIASLRFWEPRTHAVSLGRSSRESGFVLPSERRSTGGGTVLLGPGCLCFSLALPVELYPALRDVRDSYCSILGSIGAALGLDGVTVSGSSDLAWNGRKFSGNAQRRTRQALLHHGTVLYAFDLARVTAALAEPDRQPEYRERRRHAEFLTNVPLTAPSIRTAIEEASRCHFQGPSCARSG